MKRHRKMFATLLPEIRRKMLWAAAAVLVLLILLARWKAADIYDIVIMHMTERWYSEVLGRLEVGQRVLDVGIGTGSALCTPANAALVATKRLKIVGIDYEERYIAKARAVAANAGLSEALKVHCASVYDSALPEMVGKDFDCACAPSCTRCRGCALSRLYLTRS